MRNRIVFLTLIFMLVCPISFAEISRYAVTPDFVNRKSVFFIEFTEPPDFHAVDHHGRQKDSFQYYISHDNVPFEDLKWADERHVDTVIRGGEIHKDGVILIRKKSGNGGEGSGGWGPVMGSVPYKLKRNKLRFTVPWSMLGDSDGIFSYKLLYMRYGGMTSPADVMFGISADDRL